MHKLFVIGLAKQIKVPSEFGTVGIESDIKQSHNPFVLIDGQRIYLYGDGISLVWSYKIGFAVGWKWFLSL